MEHDGDDQIDGQRLPQSSTLFLEHVGEVVLTSDSNGLSWNTVQSSPNNNGLSHWETIKMFTKSVSVTEIKFSDIYAAEFIHHGVIHGPTRPNRESFQMYRFTVHGFRRSKDLWELAEFTFGHRDRQMCETWVKRIHGCLELEEGRPKNLMVFVHPRSGKSNGCKIWASVAPIFSSAEVKTKVIVTERAGHGFDVMASLSNKELDSYDGVVAVGGDGFFNEIINGFLKNRHKTPYPPAPPDFAHDLDETAIEPSPLPSTSHDGNGDASCSSDHEFLIPNERFRFGIIPAGSTDAVVMCTTGARDPVTSALQIVLGKKVSLDLAQVVRWKLTSASKVEPSIRYAASFAGYGFYGDVITESEKLQWMGPKRYDYAGTKVFLRHRSYDAEISYLEVKNEERKQESCSPSTPERVICRVNCEVCSAKASLYGPEGNKWAKLRGRYISVGAAIISCRNKRAPDGLVADAHLSDGLLDLILIKDCPHASYLWHLTQLAQKGGKPLDFKFVEHHKTPAFTFTSSGKESVWNLDGEIFEAHQLSAQVCRGLVTLFATGPQI